MQKLCVVVAVLSLLPSALLFSQEWSAAQKEIWMNVETYSALADAGNAECYLAYVHYYYSYLYKDAEGKEKSSFGRWTDILMKQGDKWVMIGDHGRRTSKD